MSRQHLTTSKLRFNEGGVCKLTNILYSSHESFQVNSLQLLKPTKTRQKLRTPKKSNTRMGKIGRDISGFTRLIRNIVSEGRYVFTSFYL